MLLTNNIDCGLRLENIKTAKVITYTISTEQQENMLTSLSQEYILGLWGEA